MRKTSAICDLLYKKIIPEVQQDAEITKTMNANEKFSIVHGYVLVWQTYLYVISAYLSNQLMFIWQGLLHKTDNIAVRILNDAEKEARFQRRFLYKEALKARVLQNRFKLLTKQLKNHCHL